MPARKGVAILRALESEAEASKGIGMWPQQYQIGPVCQRCTRKQYSEKHRSPIPEMTYGHTHIKSVFPEHGRRSERKSRTKKPEPRKELTGSENTSAQQPGLKSQQTQARKIEELAVSKRNDKSAGESPLYPTNTP